MKRLLLIIGDIAILYLALLATLFIRYYNGHFNEQVLEHITPFSLIFIIWLIIFYIFNLYEQRQTKNTPDFYSQAGTAIIISAALTVSAFYLIPLFSITPKTNMFIFLGIFSFLFSGWRYMSNKIIASSAFSQNILIIGLDQKTIEIANILNSNPQLGYSLAGIIDLGNNRSNLASSSSYHIISGMENFNELIKSHAIKMAILNSEIYNLPQVTKILYKALGQGVYFENFTNFYEYLTSRVPLHSISQNWFLDNIRSSKKFYQIAKRLADLAGAILLGIITLAITPLIAFAIKWTSAGPVFYRQKRTGQNGTIFKLIKFRSMIANDPFGGAEAETGALWSPENDPRVTVIGKFLRKARIDELPQLWNIIKGEMSFVGPRAERPELHVKIIKEIPFYEERYLVKPGATGWAQLQKNYYSSITETAEKLQYDLYYIKNRSLVLDLVIILKTINVILRGGGR